MATKKQILAELIALQKNLDKACKRAENISLKIDLHRLQNCSLSEHKLKNLLKWLRVNKFTER